MKKLNLELVTRGWVVLLLLVGVIFNIISIVYFRLNVQNRLEIEYRNFTASIQKSNDDFILNVRDVVSQMFATNMVNVNRTLEEFKFARSSSNFSSSSKIVEDILPFYQLCGSIPYDFYIFDGLPCCRISSQHFKVGSRFPRGGFITDIFADCLIVDNRFRFDNSNQSKSLYKPEISPVPTNPIIKEISQDV